MRTWLAVAAALACGLTGLARIGTGGLTGTTSNNAAAVQFAPEQWHSRFVQAWEQRDVSKFADLYSTIYANGGDSKDDTVRMAAETFSRYDQISCRFRILRAHQFEDPSLASIKYALEITGRRAGAQDLEPIVQTMGYQSLMYEGGQWRMYAMQFFCDPRMPKFDFDQDRGNWPSPNVQIHLTSYEPAHDAPPDPRWITDLPSLLPVSLTEGAKAGLTFDKSRWERRVADGWNNKDAALILSCFSKLYNEVGVSREEANRPVGGFFTRFDTLRCRYRVLAFRQFPGRNLATVKAVMEMGGVPAGQQKYITFIQTMGYASLIFEDGDWRMYASQLWYWPKVPHFNLDTEQGNWPPYGTVVDMN